jgi:eukaryotic-like serine/threonine-protein kinase
MQCPLCQADNPPTAEQCTKCSTPLPLASDVTISPTQAIGSTEAWSVAVTPRPSSEAASKGQLEPGTVLAERFEILQLLGQGGMGAVYKARDNELERLVAIKLIRADLASHPEILRRFKQELILAREVTHRNVIRIFDLGQAQGIKFITMEYVEGRDLRGLIHEKGKLTPEETVPIVMQIAAALDAAHTAGVVHRDLKPQNVMVDKDGRVYVMDFGIARSLETPGMTQTGALMGTPEYMSPEQAKGEKVDARSDLFALGIIFYEMLTGISPFKAETAMAMMFKRTQERATPLAQLNLGVPALLSDIVARCLEIKTEERYQSARDVINDLEAWQGGAPRGTIVPTSRRIRYAPSYQKWLVAGAGVVLLAILGFVFRGKLASLSSGPGKSAASAQPISLAILPFHNASTDTSLDWIGTSLSDMLSTDVGQSSRLRTVPADRLHQTLKDLRIPANADFDPATLRQLAQFSNADILVSGHYAKFGDQIRIDAMLQDLRRDRRVPLKIEAASEQDLPGTVDKLADLIRNNLAVSSDVLKELKASSFQPTSKSVPALRDYTQGLQLLRDGKNLDAVKAFQDAVKADPQFALAFSKLGQTYSALGYDSEAEQSARRAVELSEDLPEAEKYLVSAIRYQVTKNFPEAIKAYENLAKASPDNSDVESVLASLYKDSGDLAKAREYYQKLRTANPNDVAATLELGRVAIKSGDPQSSLEPLNRAYSLATQMDNQEQKATSLHFTAVAYGMLGKPEEELRNEREALVIWRAIGEKRGLALSLNQLASAQASLGKPKDALASYQEALNLRREIGDKRGIGDSLIDLGNFQDDRGDHDQALKMYKEALQLERDLGNESLQAACLNNIGNAYLNKGQYEDALTYFQQVVQLREKTKVPGEIVDAVHNLGYTSAVMGQYDQATSYYMKALDLRRSMDDRRGAAMESYGLAGLFGYQGRFGAAINSMQDALKTFREIKDRTYLMGKTLGGYSRALILAGRGDEAKSSLDEALSLSRELKNDGLAAEILGIQGEAFFYAGDIKSAQVSFTQAVEAATRSKEPDTILIAKANLVRVQVQEKRPVAIASLRQLIQQANDLGLKYVSAESSITMAEAMMQSHDYVHARQELERALLLSDKLGMQPLSARAHYLLATMARDSGNSSEAHDNYREALRLLDAMKKDPGAEKLLQRADFKAIYDASTAGSQAAKS